MVGNSFAANRQITCNNFATTSQPISAVLHLDDGVAAGSDFTFHFRARVLDVAEGALGGGDWLAVFPFRLEVGASKGEDRIQVSDRIGNEDVEMHGSAVFSGHIGVVNGYFHTSNYLSEG